MQQDQQNNSDVIKPQDAKVAPGGQVNKGERSEDLDTRKAQLRMIFDGTIEEKLKVAGADTQTANQWDSYFNSLLSPDAEADQKLLNLINSYRTLAGEDQETTRQLKITTPDTLEQTQFLTPAMNNESAKGKRIDPNIIRNAVNGVAKKMISRGETLKVLPIQFSARKGWHIGTDLTKLRFNERDNFESIADFSAAKQIWRDNGAIAHANMAGELAANAFLIGFFNNPDVIENHVELIKLLEDSLSKSQK